MKTKDHVFHIPCMKSYGISDKAYTFNSWKHTLLKSVVMREKKTKYVREKQFGYQTVNWPDSFSKD